MLSDEPFRLAPKPIQFASQRRNFRVRVFQCHMRLLEFLSQSRDLVAEGLFWAVRPIHNLVHPSFLEGGVSQPDCKA